jgi:hypothetical protein
LIRPFATSGGKKVMSPQRFPGDWQPMRSRYQIHINAAEDNYFAHDGSIPNC